MRQRHSFAHRWSGRQSKLASCSRPLGISSDDSGALTGNLERRRRRTPCNRAIAESSQSNDFLRLRR